MFTEEDATTINNKDKKNLLPPLIIKTKKNFKLAKNAKIYSIL